MKVYLNDERKSVACGFSMIFCEGWKPSPSVLINKWGVLLIVSPYFTLPLCTSFKLRWIFSQKAVSVFNWKNVARIKNGNRSCSVKNVFCLNMSQQVWFGNYVILVSMLFCNDVILQSLICMPFRNQLEYAFLQHLICTI